VPVDRTAIGDELPVLDILQPCKRLYLVVDDIVPLVSHISAVPNINTAQLFPAIDEKSVAKEAPPLKITPILLLATRIPVVTLN
jgi:hypothetical protein